MERRRGLRKAWRAVEHTIDRITTSPTEIFVAGTSIRGFTARVIEYGPASPQVVWEVIGDTALMIGIEAARTALEKVRSRRGKRRGKMD